MAISFLENPHFFKHPLEDYVESQVVSYKLDKDFGFNVDAIESKLKNEASEKFPDGNQQNWGPLLYNDRQAWIGLDPKQLQTPYNEIYHMIDLIGPKKGQKIIDLGAGYGRMGLVIESMVKDVDFLGIEYISSRVEDGNNVFRKLGLKNSSLVTDDLIRDDFELPEADFYFMYDFGKKEHIKKVLDQLFRISKTKNFRLIARGRGCRGIIQYHYPWLSQVFDVVHEETFSIYSSFEWSDLT